MKDIVVVHIKMIRSILLLILTFAVIANAQYTDWKTFSGWDSWDSEDATTTPAVIDSGLLNNWDFEIWITSEAPVNYYH